MVAEEARELTWAPRPGTVARRGGGPGCTPKLPGPGLGGTRSRVCTRGLAAPVGFPPRAPFNRPLLVSAGHQGGFPAPGWGRGGEGGGPGRPPLLHCGPGVPGESWGAVTSTLSGWEGADRPPPQPRPRRPQRRSWGTVVPDSTETGPVLPHPTHPAPQIAGPIVPRQGLHSGFGVTLFPLGRGWSFVSF